MGGWVKNNLNFPISPFPHLPISPPQNFPSPDRPLNLRLQTAVIRLRTAALK
jgi:hypothetical protein